MVKNQRMYVSRSIAKEGTEFEKKGIIWKVKVILAERTHYSFGGGYSDYLCMCEYQETVIERMQREIKELQEIHKNGCTEMVKELKKNYLVVTQVGFPEVEVSRFRANCPECGAMVYSAQHPSTFKEVIPVERPYCQHCGVLLDASKVETDESKYNTSQ